MSRPITSISLSDLDKERLVSKMKREGVSGRWKIRAKIILMRGAGISQSETSEQLNVSRVTISKWTKRFAVMGPLGLNDMEGRGRKRSISLKTYGKVMLCEETAKNNTYRSRAQFFGISTHSVRRVWTSPLARNAENKR